MTLYHGGIRWWLRRLFCYIGWHASDRTPRWCKSDNYYLPVHGCERCRYCRKRVNVMEHAYGPWDMGPDDGGDTD